MLGNDIMKYLEIKNVYFKNFGGITFVIRILEITIDKITIVSSGELPDKGILIIESNNSEYKIFTTVVKDFSMNNSYTLFLEDPLDINMQNKITEIENIKKDTEKRKEDRYDVGLNNWRLFGLKLPETSIIASKEIVKCIISNASFHGVLLVGTRSFIKIGDRIIFQCQFNDIALKQEAIIVNSIPLKQNYFSYSLRFMNPSLEWCKRILNYSNIYNQDKDD